MRVLLPTECEVRGVGLLLCWAPVPQTFIFALKLKMG